MNTYTSTHHHTAFPKISLLFAAISGQKNDSQHYQSLYKKLGQHDASWKWGTIITPMFGMPILLFIPDIDTPNRNPSPHFDFTFYNTLIISIWRGQTPFGALRSAPPDRIISEPIQFISITSLKLVFY